MKKWILLCGLLAAVWGQNQPFFLTANGKQVDPCAMDSIHPHAGAFPDVNELRCRPGEGQTIYIPRANDPNYNNPNILAGTSTIPVTGRNLQAGNVIALCLGGYDAVAQVALGCAACDPNFLQAPYTFLTDTTGSFNLQTLAGAQLAWNDPRLLREREARRICIVPAVGNPRYSGLRVAINQNCQSDAMCGTLITQGLLDPGRISCCRSQFNLQGTLSGAVGICINPSVQTCCGGVPHNPATSKCCNPTAEIVEHFNTPCPCQRVANGPNGCPASESLCCLHTKYAELSTIAVPAFGQCYDGVRHKCCNTGQRFDPGTYQCCSINGLQSLNDPCPCQEDQHCQSGIVGDAPLPLKCCRQFFPIPMETAFCNAYNNYPGLDAFSSRNGNANGNSRTLLNFNTILDPNPVNVANPVTGNAPARIQDLISRRDLGNGIGRGVKETQRCNGVCYDPSYQICCNGVTCVREYEKCCNSTCCNRFVGTCAEAYRAGTPNNRFNYIGFGNRFEQCSTIEQISILRAWWIFVLPTKLLALTLIALAFVLVFANRGTTRSHSLIERALIVTGCLVVLFALPNFFSPAYKYGIVMVIVGLVGILCAAERTRWLNIVAIIVIIIGLFYLFDPFHGGNDVLSFSSFRYTDNSVRDDESSGILHFIGNKAWRNLTVVNSKDNFCVSYYDYFRLDPQLRDIRFENPLVTTFGYCGRGWITALLIFEAILCFFAILLLVLALIAFFLRFAVESFEPIELALEQNFAPPPLAPFAPVPVY